MWQFFDHIELMIEGGHSVVMLEPDGWRDPVDPPPPASVQLIPGGSLPVSDWVEG